jgi:hypothetical protein
MAKFCALTIAVFVTLPATGQAQLVQCTMKLEACGALEQNVAPLTKIKEGVCLKADLATIGNKPTGLYYSAVVWVGVRISGDTLVFGKGEAKTGIALECSWNLQEPRPQQQIDSLKASIPQLLNNETFQKQFPGIRKIDVSKLKKIDIADGKCTKALANFAMKK